jgi:hypothetical protein
MVRPVIAMTSAEPSVPLKDAEPEPPAALHPGPVPRYRKLVSIGVFVALVPLLGALDWAFDVVMAAAFGAAGLAVAAALRLFFERLYLDD